MDVLVDISISKRKDDDLTFIGTRHIVFDDTDDAGLSNLLRYSDRDISVDERVAVLDAISRIAIRNTRERKVV